MRTIVILFLVMLLTACKSSSNIKSTIEVEKDVGAIEQTQIAEQTQTSSLKTIEVIELLTSDWEYRLLTYDTSLPIDSISGKPPLKSDLLVKKKDTAIKQAKSSEESNDSTQKSLSKNTAKWERTDSVNRAKTVLKKDYSPPAVWMLWIAFLAVMGVINFSDINKWLKKRKS